MARFCLSFLSLLLGLFNFACSTVQPPIVNVKLINCRPTVIQSNEKFVKIDNDCAKLVYGERYNVRAPTDEKAIGKIQITKVAGQRTLAQITSGRPELGWIISDKLFMPLPADKLTELANLPYANETEIYNSSILEKIDRLFAPPLMACIGDSDCSAIADCGEVCGVYSFNRKYFDYLQPRVRNYCAELAFVSEVLVTCASGNSKCVEHVCKYEFEK